MLSSLRRAFFAGIVLLAPITVTFYVFDLLLSALGGRFRNLFFFFVPDTVLDRPELRIAWNFLGTLLVLTIIAALGYLSRYVLTRLLFRTTERVINRLPLINEVYTSAKQIAQTIALQGKGVLQQTVVIEYPRKNVYTIGFVTNTSKGEADYHIETDLLNIFVPTTPNPTTGLLLMVPKAEVLRLDMSIGDALKIIISGGAMIPAFNTTEAACRITSI